MPIGAAMLFVLSLVVSAIIGLLTATYAARTFLNVLNGTAAADDEIPWLADPYFDWVGNLFFLAYLIALPSVPAFGIVGLIHPEFLDHPAGPALVFFGVVWLVFPIMLLSALSGTSRWYVLHWEFLRRLPRRPIAVAVFYLSTALVLLIGGGSLYLAILHPNPYAAAAVVPLAACVLIHGRLFGRLGWVVGQTPVGAKTARKRRVRGVVASDPWQVPLRRDDPPPAPAPETAFTALEPRPIAAEVTTSSIDVEEDEWTPNKKPYALSSDAPPMIQASNPLREAITAAPHARADDDDEDSAAALNMLPATPLEPDNQHQPEPPKLDHIEVRWQEGRKMPVLPRWPLLGGVWEFPFYATALERLVILSALCFLLVLAIRFMLILSGGEIRGAL